jgi:hypothetical protein
MICGCRWIYGTSVLDARTSPGSVQPKSVCESRLVASLPVASIGASEEYLFHESICDARKSQSLDCLLAGWQACSQCLESIRRVHECSGWRCCTSTGCLHASREQASSCTERYLGSRTNASSRYVTGAYGVPEQQAVDRCCRGTCGALPVPTGSESSKRRVSFYASASRRRLWDRELLQKSPARPISFWKCTTILDQDAMIIVYLRNIRPRVRLDEVCASSSIRSRAQTCRFAHTQAAAYSLENAQV